MRSHDIVWEQSSFYVIPLYKCLWIRSTWAYDVLQIESSVNKHIMCTTVNIIYVSNRDVIES